MDENVKESDRNAWNDALRKSEEFLYASTLERQIPTSLLGVSVPPCAKVDAEQRRIALTEPDLLQDSMVNFLELVELRSTVRQYAEKPLTEKELSYLLWCTQGVKAPMQGGASIRNVPSAGARHSFETYLYIQRVEGIEEGLYHFLPYEHSICKLDLETEAFVEAFCFKAPIVRNSAVTFVWTSVIERLRHKFGARAYRYAFLDAGHVCQNLYLSTGTIQSGACALGAYSDELLNKALHIDGVEEFAVYAAAVGKI